MSSLDHFITYIARIALANKNRKPVDFSIDTLVSYYKRLYKESITGSELEKYITDCINGDGTVNILFNPVLLEYFFKKNDNDILTNIYLRPSSLLSDNLLEELNELDADGNAGRIVDMIEALIIQNESKTPELSSEKVLC